METTPPQDERAGTLTPKQVQEVRAVALHVADVSPELAHMLIGAVAAGSTYRGGDWLPWLSERKAALLQWSDGTLADAVRASTLAALSAVHRSPEVQRLVGRACIAITNRAAARLAPQH